MALGQRFLQVNITIPQTGQVLTLDQTLDVHVKIHKDALAIQNKAEVTVFNLTQSMRQQLLSNLTALNKRAVDQGASSANMAAYCPVVIMAGNTRQAANGTNNGSNAIVVFEGYAVMADPIDAPPNLGVHIQCYERQLDKVQWQSDYMPAQATFKDYANWVGKQMGVTQTICQTSYDDKVITNPAATASTLESLLVDLQSYYRPNVTAFVDNDVLIVTDQGKSVSLRGTTTIQSDEFIGTPMWTDYGITATTLFNPSILLAGAVILNSKMNPKLNDVGYVVTTLDYDLSSRDTAFYGTLQAYPPA